MTTIVYNQFYKFCLYGGYMHWSDGHVLIELTTLKRFVIPANRTIVDVLLFEVV